MFYWRSQQKQPINSFIHCCWGDILKILGPCLWTYLEEVVALSSCEIWCIGCVLPCSYFTTETRQCYTWLCSQLWWDSGCPKCCLLTLVNLVNAGSLLAGTILVPVCVRQSVQFIELYFLHWYERCIRSILSFVNYVYKRIDLLTILKSYSCGLWYCLSGALGKPSNFAVMHDGLFSVLSDVFLIQF